MRSVFRQTRGQSLVAVMVAGVIGAIIMLAVSQMVSTGVKSARMVSSKLDLNHFVSTIQLIFTDDALCSQAFRDSAGNAAKFDPTDTTRDFVSHIYMDNQPVYTHGKQVVEGRTLDSIELFELNPALRKNQTVGGVARTSYVTRVEIRLKKVKGLIGPETIKREFTIRLATNDATKEIQECGLNAEDSSCPAGKMMMGINADGTLRCEDIPPTASGECPTYYVMYGVNPDGSPKCKLQVGLSSCYWANTPRGCWRGTYLYAVCASGYVSRGIRNIQMCYIANSTWRTAVDVLCCR